MKKLVILLILIFSIDCLSQALNLDSLNQYYGWTVNGIIKKQIKVVKGNNEFTINLTGFSTGIYLIQAELNGICSKTVKLIFDKNKNFKKFLN